MIALHFGPHDEIVLAFSGMVYKFVEGTYTKRYDLTDVLAIHRAYTTAHGGRWNGVQAIDALAWWAGQQIVCTALVVVGHWERLPPVDTINSATDAMYAIELCERADQLAGMPI
jgi:hypothetical protein